MDSEPRAGRRKQWPVLALAGLFVAAVASTAPSTPDQSTSDDRDVPAVKTPHGHGRGENLGADGNPFGAPRYASSVLPGGEFTVRPATAARKIPLLAFWAYQRAAATQADCHLPVSLLAAIGKVESGHARGGQLDAAGTSTHPILGPTLDGSPGLAAIEDTDGGALDGDPRWDRAVGPMQFIPSTWRRWATDGNDDGDANPHNVFDAAGAAGRYLCANDRDLATEEGLRSAILSYNHSPSYLRIVRTWMTAYELGSVVPVDWIPPTAAPVGAPPPPPPPPSSSSSSSPSPSPPPPSAGPGGPAADNPAPPAPTAPPEPGAPAGPEQPAAPAPGQDPITGTVTGLVCVVDGAVDAVGGLLTGIGGLVGGTTGPPTTPAPACGS